MRPTGQIRFRVSLRYCGGQSLTPSLLRNRFPIRRMGAGGGVPSSAPESLSTSFHCTIILPHFRRESKANTKICSIAQSLSPEIDSTRIFQKSAQMFVSVGHGDMGDHAPDTVCFVIDAQNANGHPGTPGRPASGLSLIHIFGTTVLFQYIAFTK